MKIASLLLLCCNLQIIVAMDCQMRYSGIWMDDSFIVCLVFPYFSHTLFLGGTHSNMSHGTQGIGRLRCLVM